MKRSRQDYELFLPVVKKIMAEVKNQGDLALKKYTQKFDGADLIDLTVSPKEIKEAYNLVDKNFLSALKQTIKKITTVHQQQLPATAEKTIKPSPGIKVWKKWQPIDKVGLYVPGGRALYPSSVLMNGLPAKIAGCPEIVIATPPQANGKIAPEILVTANEIGIKKIFKVGGIQAIAALTYGTKTVPKVYKIVGPGNSYVTTAKLYGLITGEVAIDSPAGPSENLIIADNTANPKLVAADLMCDSEHGPDSAAILVTNSKILAQKVAREIRNKINQFFTKNHIRKSLNKYSQIIITKSISECINFANEYAPEHLQIMTNNAKTIARKIKNAGSIFIGNYTCKSAGDYATGANHVLPTGGSAKMFSGLSVLDFVRLVEYQRCTKAGLKNIRQTIETFAKVENLPVHKYSCSVRFKS